LAWAIHGLFARPAEYTIFGPIPRAEASYTPISRPILPLSSPSSTETDEWAGYPLLRRISACEITGDPNGTPRQFLPDASVLWGNDPTTGRPIKRDVGILQINEWVWGKLAASMGDDLAAEAGNIAFGKWLFDKQGSAPWTASKGCWQ
jgi:hypothetical protein